MSHSPRPTVALRSAVGKLLSGQPVSKKQRRVRPFVLARHKQHHVHSGLQLSLEAVEFLHRRYRMAIDTQHQIASLKSKFLGETIGLELSHSEPLEAPQLHFVGELFRLIVRKA